MHLYSLKSFWYDATSFAHLCLSIICHSSPDLFPFQALSGWMGAGRHFQVSPEIFHWVQWSQCCLQATLDVCLGSLNLLPSLRFWMLWTGFSLRLSQYFGALSFSSTLSPEKQPHSMRLLQAHFTFGMMPCRWWAELVSFKHNVWNWGSWSYDHGAQLEWPSASYWPV